MMNFHIVSSEIQEADVASEADVGWKEDVRYTDVATELYTVYTPPSGCCMESWDQLMNNSKY